VPQERLLQHPVLQAFFDQAFLHARKNAPNSWGIIPHFLRAFRISLTTPALFMV
jgi:hypothetical protein